MDMLCDKCKKNTATYHYKQNVNGQVTELHLCPACAAESTHGAFSSMDSLGGISSLLTGALREAVAPVRRVCPVCGTSSADIAKSGCAGCPACYQTFAAMFAPYIAKLHGHVTHRGRIPLAAQKPEDPAETRRRQMEQLKKELDEAIQYEQFEQAAVLRDRINALKQEEKAPDPADGTQGAPEVQPE